MEVDCFISVENRTLEDVVLVYINCLLSRNLPGPGRGTNSPVGGNVEHRGPIYEQQIRGQALLINLVRPHVGVMVRLQSQRVQAPTTDSSEPKPSASADPPAMRPHVF